MVREWFSKKERLGRALLNEVRRNGYVYNSPSLEEVRRLLDAGANVNYTEGPHSVLSQAARSPWSSADIVRLLIERGANVNETQRPGLNPPLWVAARQNNTRDGSERLRLLIDAGADYGKYHELTPLNFLCLWAEPDIIDHLLAHGANPNEAADGVRGWRPIHLTAYLGRAANIEVLLKHSADISLRDEEGCTAADIAAGRHSHGRYPEGQQEEFDAVLRVLGV